jgi:hypothetical protein
LLAVLSPKAAGHRWLLAKRLAMPAMRGLLDRNKYEDMHGQVIQGAHKYGATMTSADLLEKDSTERAVLRGDQQIAAVIDEMWTVVDMNKAGGELTKPSYIQWSMALHKALIPAVTEKEAAIAAQQDWAIYSDGNDSIEYGAFLRAVFQLADAWVDQIDASEYACFLRKLLGSISTSNQPPSSWRSFEDIKCLVNPEVQTEDEAVMEVIDALIEVFREQEEEAQQQSGRNSTELSRRGSIEIVQSQISRWNNKLFAWSKSFSFNSQNEGHWGSKQKAEQKKTGGQGRRLHNARSNGRPTDRNTRMAANNGRRDGRRDSRGPSHFHVTAEYRGRQAQEERGGGRRRGRDGSDGNGCIKGDEEDLVGRLVHVDANTLPHLRGLRMRETDESSHVPYTASTSSTASFTALPHIGSGNLSCKQPSSWQQDGDRGQFASTDRGQFASTDRGQFASTPATMSSASGTSAVTWRSFLDEEAGGRRAKTPRQRLAEQQQRKEKAARRLRKEQQKRLQQRATRLIRSFPATDAKRRVELQLQRECGTYDVDQW